MRRQVSLEEISDGHLYGLNDMVKADCGGCRGCSACCRGMGSSIVLDPLDVFRLMKNLGKTFEELVSGPLELGVADGLILPSIKMKGPGEACSFLGNDGRCQVHAFRPGICRIFPLGRYYENGGFSYFLQIHECRKENRTKVKVKKWIDTPEPKRYDQYICNWHYFLEEMEAKADGDAGQDGAVRKRICMDVLTRFYASPYQAKAEDMEGFFREFDERLKAAREALR